MDSALDRVFDWTSFQRLDNAAVVEFLTSNAAALCDLDLISRKDIDDLRVCLSSIQASSEKRGQPLLLELERDQGDFLRILLSRCGASGLSLNLLRHTLGERVHETRRILADFGQILLGRAELLFNRPIQLFSGSRPERQTLFSAFLIEWAEKVAESEGRLASVSQSLSVMIGHGMAGSRESDLETDETVARFLGFQKVIYPVLLGQAESEIQHELAMIFGQLARVSTLFLKQIAANLGSEAAYVGLATMEWLQGEAQRLEHPDLLEGANLFAMEMRRRHLLSTLSGINGILGQLLLLVTQCLSSSEGTLKTDGMKIPESIRRRLIFELIVSGASPSHAAEAVQALFMYLGEHRIHVRDVLLGELFRIHPALTQTTLEIMGDLTSEQSASLALYPEKDRAIERAASLADVFNKILSSVVLPLLACAILLPACGLKISPRSDIVELRPDIPFRELPAADEVGPPRPEEVDPVRGDN